MTQVSPITTQNAEELLTHYLDTFRDCGSIFANSAYPESPESAAEGVDFLFTAFTVANIICRNTNPNYPQFVTVGNQLIPFGGPSPDISYHFATISGEKRYRFFGNVNSIYAIDVQIGSDYIGFAERPGDTLATKRLHEYDINPDGSFEVLLSQTRPENHTGNWLQLDQSATYLLVRSVAYHPNELNPNLAIECLDVDNLPVAPDATQQRLTLILSWMRMNATIFTSVPKRQKEHGVINRLDPFQFGAAVVEGQLYYEGIFQLTHDEALIIEIDISSCFYWNIQLNDMLWRTLDYVNHQSGLNGHVDRADNDGITRIVISAQDPGVENWLDTIGHTEGDIFMRFLEIEQTPAPKVTKIAFADLEKHLPTNSQRVSIEQRKKALQQRRAGYQLRHHGW